MDTSPTAAIALRDVTVAYTVARGRSIVAVDGVDLTSASGTFTALIGPSGCGKSTLLRLVAGLLEPTRGTVRIDDAPPAQLTAQHRLGVAFQDDALLPWLTVRENVALPFRAASRLVAYDRVDQMIERVGMAGFADVRPPQLSGGMRQRVAIGRALILDPLVLLLDEPFGALDAVTRRALNLELQRIWSARAMTTILVTHSVDEAVFLADRVVVMSPSPGRVRRVVSVPFVRPRARELLFERAFHALVDELTESLDNEIPSS